MLHATLFLFKSTTFDGSHLDVSVYIHNLKGKHYDLQYAWHRFCPSTRLHIALAKGRIRVPKCLSGKVQAERSLLHA